MILNTFNDTIPTAKRIVDTIIAIPTNVKLNIIIDAILLSMNLINFFT